MSFVRGCFLAVLFAAVAGSAAAQRAGMEPYGSGQLPAGVQADSATAPDASVGAALENLAARADVVFVGQVEKIEHKGGVVEVLFAVEEPVAGAVGGSYTLREWAGLWTGGRQRYFVGQRAMVFLHAQGVGLGGVAGLSSPVDGMDGVVPVVVQGADAQPLVDVRWLAARTERTVGSPLGGEESGAITLAAATSLVRGGKERSLPEPVRLPLRPKPIFGEATLEVGK